MKRLLTKRFLLFPEFIRSKHDRQGHYITFGTLVNLYKLNVLECVNADDFSQVKGRNLEDLIWLRPRYEGDYAEHLQKKLLEHKALSRELIKRS